MYIQVTIDLKHYTGEKFDLRLSDTYSIKKLIHIIWQAKNISVQPREGYWIKVKNKHCVCSGNTLLSECSITTGDRIEIL